MEKMKLTAKSLTEEIAVCLKDEFVATFTQKEEGIELAFANGQKFSLKIEEL